MRYFCLLFLAITIFAQNPKPSEFQTTPKFDLKEGIAKSIETYTNPNRFLLGPPVGKTVLGDWTILNRKVVIIAFKETRAYIGTDQTQARRFDMGKITAKPFFVIPGTQGRGKFKADVSSNKVLAFQGRQLTTTRKLSYGATIHFDFGKQPPPGK